MKEKLNIELYKEIYIEELKTKVNIDSQLSLPMNLIVILIGIGLFLFQKHYVNSHNNSLYMLLLTKSLFALFGGLVALSTMYLMKMYLNGFYKYQYLPISTDLQKTEGEFVKSNKDQAKMLKKKTVSNTQINFDAYLRDCYIITSSNNRIVNDERMKTMYLSKLYLMISILLIALIGFLVIQK
ncbi:hypothetical protein [Flavobacterium humi]|uniref:Uncharacterized protein n=1 Tax=Flavobacterium humi TaxID=2562683 RepID=A0A4Z0L921_9FLAO|nr:hypothetical protein [Flavobacterium humi]TGD58965.1 hypothetical protein E4635_03695 [Flavobacterium humi]